MAVKYRECEKIERDLVERDLAPPVWQEYVAKNGYHHAMGRCTETTFNCPGKAAHPGPYEPPPKHYPRCHPDSSSEVEERNYRRTQRTTQQDYGWEPGRHPGAGTHEYTILHLPPKLKNMCDVMGEGHARQAEREMAEPKARPERDCKPNICTIDECLKPPTQRNPRREPKPSSCPPIVAEEAHHAPPDWRSRHARDYVAPGEGRNLKPYDPRGDVTHDACVPNTRPQWMYAPKTFATSYRGIKHQLEPDKYPKELYGDPTVYDSSMC